MRDFAHITEGAIGDHVAKIQLALMDRDGPRINPVELSSKRYGPSTASVLSFKQERKIINQAYQSQPDNIVGKMAIAPLDKEMLDKQEVVPPRLQVVCLRPFPTQRTDLCRQAKPPSILSS